jgi:predicted GH43/DUF377 family glycosyl hydrolase
MLKQLSIGAVALLFIAAPFCARGQTAAPVDTTGGWVKYAGNPVIGAEYGTLFDIYVLHDEGIYRMWASWRPKKSIALLESKDGFHFSEAPKIVFGPAATGWEDDINRPAVLKRPDGYHMWYTAQTADHSAIGYATSPDGVNWKRMSAKPVLSPTQPWEKVAAICADVMWDSSAKVYKMWYSAGPQAESDAIGYATSPDGLTWTKSDKNPIFTGDPNIPWEKERGVGAHVEKRGGWYYMFYIGFHDIGHAQLGLARSRDGITNWQRLPQNPIIRLGTGKWDNDSCYKPYAIFDGSKWILWYGGRNQSVEQVGVATHEGADLGFPAAQ